MLLGILAGCDRSPPKPTPDQVKAWCVQACTQADECGIETGRTKDECLARCDSEEGLGTFDSRCGAESFVRNSCTVKLSCEQIATIGKAPLQEGSPCYKEESAVTDCINAGE